MNMVFLFFCAQEHLHYLESDGQFIREYNFSTDTLNFKQFAFAKQGKSNQTNLWYDVTVTQ